MRLFLLLLIVLAGCLSSTASIKGRILLIPPNYVGETFIEYGVHGAPALPLEDGWQVISIPAGGWVKTSSHIEEGWRAADRLYFWDGKTRTPVDVVVSGYMSLGGQNGSWDCPGLSSPVHSQVEMFFLGTDYQWKTRSYQHWSSVHCPSATVETSWPNKVEVTTLTRGTPER